MATRGRASRASSSTPATTPASAPVEPGRPVDEYLGAIQQEWHKSDSSQARLKQLWAALATAFELERSHNLRQDPFAVWIWLLHCSGQSSGQDELGPDEGCGREASIDDRDAGSRSVHRAHAQEVSYISKSVDLIHQAKYGASWNTKSSKDRHLHGSMLRVAAAFGVSIWWVFLLLGPTVACSVRAMKILSSALMPRPGTTALPESRGKQIKKHQPRAPLIQLPVDVVASFLRELDRVRVSSTRGGLGELATYDTTPYKLRDIEKALKSRIIQDAVQQQNNNSDNSDDDDSKESSIETPERGRKHAPTTSLDESSAPRQSFLDGCALDLEDDVLNSDTGQDRSQDGNDEDYQDGENGYGDDMYIFRDDSDANDDDYETVDQPSLGSPSASGDDRAPLRPLEPSVANRAKRPAADDGLRESLAGSLSKRHKRLSTIFEEPPRLSDAVDQTSQSLTLATESRQNQRIRQHREDHGSGGDWATKDAKTAAGVLGDGKEVQPKQVDDDHRLPLVEDTEEGLHSIEIANEDVDGRDKGDVVHVPIPANPVDILTDTVRLLRDQNAMLHTRDIEACVSLYGYSGTRKHWMNKEGNAMLMAPGFPFAIGENRIKPEKLPDTLIFILHRSAHWTVGELDRPNRQFRHYDPLASARHSAIVKDAMLPWLRDQMQLSSVGFIDEDCTRQEDGVSCGVAAVINATDLMLRRRPATSTNAGIEFSRARLQFADRLEAMISLTTRERHHMHAPEELEVGLEQVENDDEEEEKAETQGEELQRQDGDADDERDNALALDRQEAASEMIGHLQKATDAGSKLSRILEQEDSHMELLLTDLKARHSLLLAQKAQADISTQAEHAQLTANTAAHSMAVTAVAKTRAWLASVRPPLPETGTTPWMSTEDLAELDQAHRSMLKRKLDAAAVAERTCRGSESRVRSCREAATEARRQLQIVTTQIDMIRSLLERRRRLRGELVERLGRANPDALISDGATGGELGDTFRDLLGIP